MIVPNTESDCSEYGISYTYISLEIRSSDKLKASLKRVIENYIIL